VFLAALFELNKITEPIKDMSVWEYQSGKRMNRSLLKTKDSKIRALERQFEEYMIDTHKRCLEKLAEKSDQIDKPNYKGKTPLLAAIDCKSDQWIIELLIRKGANVSHKDNEGKTALSYALKQQLGKTVELLINNGANLNDETICEPYLYLACNSPRIDSDLCKILITKGINLHCCHKGKSVFSLLSETSIRKFGPEKLEIYRNALIQELIDTFSYTDYEKFKQRVVESIENGKIILIDADHLKAFSLLSPNENKFKEVIDYLRSMEFRERLIVDYFSVLNDQKELLELRHIQLNRSLSDLIQLLEQETKKPKPEETHFKLNEIVSNELFEHLIDSVKLQTSSVLQTKRIATVTESINKYIIFNLKINCFFRIRIQLAWNYLSL